MSETRAFPSSRTPGVIVRVLGLFIILATFLFIASTASAQEVHIDSPTSGEDLRSDEKIVIAYSYSGFSENSETFPGDPTYSERTCDFSLRLPDGTIISTASENCDESAKSSDNIEIDSSGIETTNLTIKFVMSGTSTSDSVSHLTLDTLSPRYGTLHLETQDRTHVQDILLPGSPSYWLNASQFGNLADLYLNISITDANLRATGPDGPVLNHGKDASLNNEISLGAPDYTEGATHWYRISLDTIVSAGSYVHGEQFSIQFNASDSHSQWRTEPSGIGYTFGIDTHDPNKNLFEVLLDDGTAAGTAGPNQFSDVAGHWWVSTQDLTLRANLTDAFSGVDISTVTFFKNPSQPISGSASNPEGDNYTLTFTPGASETGPFRFGVDADDHARNTLPTASLGFDVEIDNTRPTFTVEEDPSAGLELENWINASATIPIKLEDAGAGVDVNSIQMTYHDPDDPTEQFDAFTDFTTTSSGNVVWVNITPSSPLANGNHTFNITFADQVSNTVDTPANTDDTNQFNILVNDTAPTVNSASLPGAVRQGENLTLELNTTSPGNVSHLTVEVLQQGTTNPIDSVRGPDGPWRTVVPVPAGADPTEFVGNLKIPFGEADKGYVPLGTHDVRVTVHKDEGVRTTSTTFQTHFLPRLLVQDAPHREDGRLTATVHAGYLDDACDGQETHPYTCPLDSLKVQYKSSSDNGGWNTIPVDADGHIDVSTSSVGPGLFAYDVNLSVEGIDDYQDLVRFVANASVDGVSHQTTVQRFVTAPNSSSVQLLTPRTGEVNATGNVDVRVEVLQAPTFLTKEQAVMEVDINQTRGNGFTNVTKRMNDTAVADDATGVYNLSTADIGQLPDGRYELSFRFYNASTPDNILFDGTSHFAVEKDGPKLSLNATTWVEKEGEQWVGNTFIAAFNVTAGFANVTGFDNVSIGLGKGGGGWFVNPQVTWLHRNDTGVLHFPEKSVDQDGDGLNDTYVLHASVKVPEVINHERSFFIVVNATDNANGTGKGDGEGRTRNVREPVRLDEKAPTWTPTATLDQEMDRWSFNATIKAGELAVNITPEADDGVGTLQEDGTYPANLVHATFLKRNATTTWFWNETSDQEGRWTKVTANVTVRTYDLTHEPTTDTPQRWSINDTELGVFSAMATDLDASYRVIVNASDLVGNRRASTPIPVSADAGAPIVTDLRVVDHPGSFKDTAHLTANVTEDNWGWWSKSAHRRANLTLVVEDPNGDVHRYNASKVDGTSTTTTRTVTWTLQGEATTWVGNYTTGFEVRDPVGQVTTSLDANGTFLDPVNFTIPDTERPQFNFMGFEPSPPAPDTPLFAQVRAFDDSGIVNATTWWWVPDQENSTVGPFQMTCEPAEGEDDPRWVLCELANSDGPNLDLVAGQSVFFNVTLEGGGGPDDVVEVGAVGEVVSDNAPPIVRKEVPPADVNWINATTTVQVSIFDRNLDKGTVQVETGTSTDNLTVQNVTLDSVGNGTHLLNLTPEGLDDGDQWVVRVHATDLQGSNTTKTWTFHVDTGAPTVTHTVQDAFVNGENETWLSGASLITLTASDDGSGMARGNVTYAVDGGASQRYTGAFALPASARGETTITVTVRDTAGNVNTTSFTVFSDPAAPSISMVKKDGRTVEAQVTDGGVGVNRSAIRLYYTLEGSDDFSSVAMTNSIDNVWTASIPSEVTGNIEFYLEARDLVGNVGRYGNASNPVPLVTGNTAPTLTLSEPTAGTTAKGSVDVAWSASDADGETVTLSFALKGSGGVNELRGNVSNGGSTTLDVSGVADGRYTLVVRATDGLTETAREVPVLVLNSDVVQPKTTPTSDATAGEPITVEVQVSHPFKNVSKVTAIIERDGQPIDEVGMTHEGGDTYALTYEPSEPGSYSVSVVVAYEDGTQDQAFQVSSFDASSPAGPGISGQILTLVMLGAMAVLLGAYAAFGRWDE